MKNFIKNFNQFNEAYVSDEEVKQIREQIKPVLKKYGLRGTIRRENYSRIVLSVKSGGKLINEFYEEKFSSYNIRTSLHTFTAEEYDKYKMYQERQKEIDDIKKELEKGLLLPTYRDNSDIMTDYFDVSYYTYIKIID